MTKRKVLTIVIIVLFIGAMAGSYFLYEKLSKTHEPSSNVASDSEEEYKDFSMTDTSGNTVKLSEFIGQPVVINFWATWCGPCKSELPHFDKIAKEYEGKVQFLMVNVFYNQKEQTLDFVAQNGYTFPLYFDDEDSATTAYGILSVPETVFITADGKIIAKRVGAMSEAVLRSYIARLLKK